MQFSPELALLFISLIACVVWLASRTSPGRRVEGGVRAPAYEKPGRPCVLPHETYPATRLERSSLCLDCETINESTGDTCYVCGATGSLLSLARVLDGPISNSLSESKLTTVPRGQLGVIRRTHDFLAR